MPESGDVDVITTPVRLHHLTARRRFNLKLDLASSITDGNRTEKKLRLDVSSPSTSLKTENWHRGNCDLSIPSDTDSPSGVRSLQLDRTTAFVMETNNLSGCRRASCLFSSTQPLPGDDHSNEYPAFSLPFLSSCSKSFLTISSAELATKCRDSRKLLIIDCRAFLHYNNQHVHGAFNLSCTDRVMRKRVQHGEIVCLDLLTSIHGEQSLERHRDKEVVLYDECGDGLSCLSCCPTEQERENTTLCFVLMTLSREGMVPVVLEGGIRKFEADYPDLCWNSRKRLEISGRLLFSPTNDMVEPEIETATISCVLPFLYLGNERVASELDYLRRYNITYVLNVTAHVPLYWNNHGILYKRIPASDNAQQNLKQYFEEAIEFIDDARQQGANVLIHCHAGVSRSATITIAYILKHTRLAMSDAYQYVKGKRATISPNFNFLGQLLEYEHDLDNGHTSRVLNPRLVELESTV